MADKHKAPKFYQYRLLKVLLSKDITELMDKHNPNSGMDLIDSHYWLLDNWAMLKDDIILMIKERIDDD